MIWYYIITDRAESSGHKVQRTVLEVNEMADMNNNQNDFFSEETQTQVQMPEGEKRKDTSSMVIGIIGIVGGLLIPIIGIGCGIGAIVTVNKNSSFADTRTGRGVGIAAIVVSVINMIAGIILNLSRAGVIGG